MRLLLLIATLFFLSSFAPPEAPAVNKLKYAVLRDGKQIGQIRASRLIQGENVVYDVETDMNVKVLISQKVHYTSRAQYQNGILQNSTAKSYVNNKLHHTCVTVRKAGHYEIKKDKDSWTLNRSVSYSGTMLYFREPQTAALVYSEMSGQDNGMKKTGDGTYTLTDGKSKKQNKYWYKGGILERAVINHTLIDIEIRLVH